MTRPEHEDQKIEVPNPEYPFHIKEHQVPAQHIREYPHAMADSQEQILYLAVKQYIPKDNPDPRPGDLTIIGAHANGFPKELYEPLWADLHVRAHSSGGCSGSGDHGKLTPGFRIRSIWIADVANQGQSGVFNAAALGNDPSWRDHARDLLCVINAFRAEMTRPLVGIGHSFGANCLVDLALLHPRLLTTLVCLDPTITRFGLGGSGPGIDQARASVSRRDVWTSAEAAEAAVRKSKFFRGWDGRVLERWLRYGLRKVRAGEEQNQEQDRVILTTTKVQEFFTFFRPLWPFLTQEEDPQESNEQPQNPNTQVQVDHALAPDFDPAMHSPLTRELAWPFYRAEGGAILRRLPELRPSVLYVFGGSSDLSTAEARREKMTLTGTGPGGSGGAAAGRVKEAVLDGRGHLFPMEVPGLCAEEVAGWLGDEVGERWWREERRGWEEWRRREGKNVLDEDTLGRVKRAGLGHGVERDGGGEGRKGSKL